MQSVNSQIRNKIPSPNVTIAVTIESFGVFVSAYVLSPV